VYEVAVAAGGTTFIPNFVDISELIEILGHTRTQSRTGGDLINLFCQEGQQTNFRSAQILIALPLRQLLQYLCAAGLSLKLL
jgi:hypothetical protein